MGARRMKSLEPPPPPSTIQPHTAIEYAYDYIYAEQKTKQKNPNIFK